MPKMLVINSSPRQERSHSRTLLEHFVALWSAQNPQVEVLFRDVALDPVPHVDEPWIIGAFAPADYQTPESQASIAISDLLVDEFLAADYYVFGVPMYNLNVPSTFKAYIDQIVRVNKTFGMGPEGYFGLVHDKKALFITASGGAFRGGTPAGSYNFQEPYLRAIFGFIGVTDVTFVVADNQNQGEELAASARAEAQDQIEHLATSWK